MSGQVMLQDSGETTQHLDQGRVCCQLYHRFCCFSWKAAPCNLGGGKGKVGMKEKPISSEVY